MHLSIIPDSLGKRKPPSGERKRRRRRGGNAAKLRGSFNDVKENPRAPAVSVLAYDSAQKRKEKKPRHRHSMVSFPQSDYPEPLPHPEISRLSRSISVFIITREKKKRKKKAERKKERKKEKKMPVSATDAPGWSAHVPAYTHVERLTGPLCQTLVDRVSALVPLESAAATAFDNGCGTGALSGVLKDRHPNLPLLATDTSDGMIEVLRRRVRERGWGDTVTLRVADGRRLDGMEDGSFTHVFSTFMVCLAPEPGKIVSEMLRVTAPGGVLGLAVWGDPRFGAFSQPWTRACRELVAGFAAPMIMDEDWTLAANVEAGLREVGFREVHVREEHVPFRWESVGVLSEYIFHGGNPANLKMVDAFRAQGGDMDKVRPIFERVIKEESGRDDGSVVVSVSATLATARK